MSESSKKRKRKHSKECLILFDVPSKGIEFDRVFKQKSLDELKETVSKKLKLTVPDEIELVRIRKGKKIALEDDLDFEALLEQARSKKKISLQVSLPGVSATVPASSAIHEEGDIASEAPPSKKRKTVTAIPSSGNPSPPSVNAAPSSDVPSRIEPPSSSNARPSKDISGSAIDNNSQPPTVNKQKQVQISTEVDARHNATPGKKKKTGSEINNKGRVIPEEEEVQRANSKKRRHEGSDAISDNTGEKSSGSGAKKPGTPKNQPVTSISTTNIRTRSPTRHTNTRPAAQNATTGPATEPEPPAKKRKKNKKAQSAADPAVSTTATNPPQPSLTTSPARPSTSTQPHSPVRPEPSVVSAPEKQGPPIKTTDSKEVTKVRKPPKCPKCKQPLKGHGKTCPVDVDSDPLPAPRPTAASKDKETVAKGGGGIERGRRPRASTIVNSSAPVISKEASATLGRTVSPAKEVPPSHKAAATSKDDAIVTNPPEKAKSRKRANSLGPLKPTTRLIVDIPPLQKRSTITQLVSNINDKLASSKTQQPSHEKSMDEMIREIVQKRKEKSSDDGAGSSTTAALRSVSAAKSPAIFPPKRKTTVSLSQPVVRKSRSRRSSEHTDICPVCLERPFHLRFRCQVIKSGSEAMKKRIRELELAASKGEKNEELVEELKAILNQAGMGNESSGKERDAKAKGKQKEVADVRKEKGAESTSKSKNPTIAGSRSKSVVPTASNAAGKKGEREVSKTSNLKAKVPNELADKKRVEPVASQPTLSLATSILAALKPASVRPNPIIPQGRRNVGSSSGALPSNPPGQHSDDEDESSSDSSSSDSSSSEEDSASGPAIGQKSQAIPVIPEATLDAIDDPSTLLRGPGSSKAPSILSPAYWTVLMEDEENPKAKKKNGSESSEDSEDDSEEVEDSEVDNRLLKKLEKKVGNVPGSTKIIGQVIPSPPSHQSEEPGVEDDDGNGDRSRSGSTRPDNEPRRDAAISDSLLKNPPAIRPRGADQHSANGASVLANERGSQLESPISPDVQLSHRSSSPPSNKKLGKTYQGGASIDMSLQDKAAALGAEAALERSVVEEVQDKGPNMSEKQKSKQRGAVGHEAEGAGDSHSSDGRDGGSSNQTTANENGGQRDSEGLLTDAVSGKETLHHEEDISDVESSGPPRDSGALAPSILDPIVDPSQRAGDPPPEFSPIESDHSNGAVRPGSTPTGSNGEVALTRGSSHDSTGPASNNVPPAAANDVGETTAVIEPLSQASGRGAATSKLAKATSATEQYDEDSATPRQNKTLRTQSNGTAQALATPSTLRPKSLLPAWNTLPALPPTSPPNVFTSQSDQLHSDIDINQGLNGASPHERVLVKASQEGEEEDDVEASLHSDRPESPETGNTAMRSRKSSVSQTLIDPRRTLRSAKLPTRKSPGLFLSSSQSPSLAFPTLRTLTQRGLGNRMSISSVMTPSQKKQDNRALAFHQDDDDDDDYEGESSSDEQDESVPAHRKAGSTLKKSGSMINGRKR